MGSKADASGLATDHWPLTTLTACPSVQLFIDRARAVQPDFELTKANAAAVAALCRGLEGLPLALELAAARAGVLAPAQMLERLSRRFELLATRQRDVVPRHRSLRAALDWSYQLLSPELQRFFARLSIFRGGFTLEAAEAVCGGEAGVQAFRRSGVQGLPDPSDPPDPERLKARTPERLNAALDCLDQLRESSLVVAEPLPGEVRVRMLETLREYAAEQLSREEAVELARRHLAYYVTLAEAAEPELAGPDQAAWLDRLELELPNLRAAMEHAAESGAIEDGLRLGGALGRFLFLRGNRAEWRQRLEGLLHRREAAGSSLIRAKALYTLGLNAYSEHDYTAARPLVEESLAIRRQWGESRGVGHCLRLLGVIALNEGDTQTARPLIEQGLQVSRDVGDAHAVSWMLVNLSVLAGAEGDKEAQQRCQEESLAIVRTTGDQWLLSIVHNNMGSQARRRSDLAAARGLFTESLAIERELRNLHGISYQLKNLGEIALVERNYVEARARFEEALAITRPLDLPHRDAEKLIRLGLVARARGEGERAASLCRQVLGILRSRAQPANIAHWLEELAALAAEMAHGTTSGAVTGPDSSLRGPSDARPDPTASLSAVLLHEWAVRLLGAAAALRAAAGTASSPPEHRELDHQLASLRAATGERAFAAAWHDGQTQPWDQVVAFLFSPAPEAPEPRPPPPG